MVPDASVALGSRTTARKSLRRRAQDQERFAREPALEVAPCARVLVFGLAARVPGEALRLAEDRLRLPVAPGLSQADVVGELERQLAHTLRRSVLSLYLPGLEQLEALHAVDGLRAAVRGHRAFDPLASGLQRGFVTLHGRFVRIEVRSGVLLEALAARFRREDVDAAVVDPEAIGRAGARPHASARAAPLDAEAFGVGEEGLLVLLAHEEIPVRSAVDDELRVARDLLAARELDGVEALQRGSRWVLDGEQARERETEGGEKRHETSDSGRRTRRHFVRLEPFVRGNLPPFRPAPEWCRFGPG